MERLCLVFTFVLIFGVSGAQSLASGLSIQGLWVVDSAMFPDNIVKLKAYKNSDTSSFYSAYEFLSNGSVRMSMHSPARRGVCGNCLTFKRQTGTEKNKNL